MKKLIIPCLLVLLISGCGKIAPQLDVNKKIYNTFSNMQGYEAVLKVNTVSNTNNNTFDTKQYYKYPDKMRSETDGVVTIMEGGRATVQNTAVGQPLKMCIRDSSGGFYDYRHRRRYHTPGNINRGNRRFKDER